MLNKDTHYVKKSDFLDALDVVYENANVEYLISLRDGLSIIINQRLNGGLKPFKNNFCGYVKV